MYTEDDQYGLDPKDKKTESDIEKEKKKFRNLIIIISSAVLFVIILIVVLYLIFSNNSKKLKLPVVNLSNSEWTNEAITLSVDDQNGKVVSYSFDGGENWQDENAMDITENGVYTVIVKDKDGKTSKPANVIVENIDREGPTINFTDPLYVQKGGTFNFKSGVNIEDSGSGLKEYISDPVTIDTSVDQEFKVLYRATDNLGNVSEKERTVIVRNLIVKTWYRSRTIGKEKYNCDPYKCSCTACTSATQKATVNCPAGYTSTGSKCKSNEVIPVGTVCSSGYYLDGTICRAYKDYQVKNNCANGFKPSADGTYCEINAKPSTKSVSFPANGCPSGWEKSGNTCLFKNDKISLIYDCANTGGVLDTSKKSCKFDKTLSCNDSKYPNLVGNKCYDVTNKYYVDANASCPQGATAEGTYCYIKAQVSCPKNTSYNSKTGYCEQVTETVLIQNKAFGMSVSYCPNNKTALVANGSDYQCFASYKLVGEKYCPSGYRDDGTKCISNTTKSTTIGCPSGYKKSGDSCINNNTIDGTVVCPNGYTLASGTTCKAISTSGQCCKTCYKTCTRESYGEWSEWTLTKITPSSKLQVETKVE